MSHDNNLYSRASIDNAVDAVGVCSADTRADSSPPEIEITRPENGPRVCSGTCGVFSAQGCTTENGGGGSDAGVLHA